MKNYKFKINGTQYEVEINDFDGKIADIEVNGTKYQVEVQSEVRQPKTPTLVRKPVAEKPGEGVIVKTPSIGGHEIKSPLPGSIIKILVAVGDTVKKGDNLLIMEAMKMENNVLAEKDGVVKSIKVAIGDNVLQNDVLLEIE
ncbi:MAG: acetyl-CoA carboxylase biotin carboxyl carrier protein subunit [Bacteroidetes bacterium]|nr:MAG: acetyl-CoA carboxylase biotin carboxyl carrier protein subunit [Bacteroidota bacterium]